MTLYLLDTCAISDLIRNPLGRTAVKLDTIVDDGVTSVIVAAELRFGAEKSWALRLQILIDQMLTRIPVLALGYDAAVIYAAIRGELERSGTPIGSNDLFIAAHALALNATLVTDNIREFGRVPGLAVENWLRH